MKDHKAVRKYCAGVGKCIPSARQEKRRMLYQIRRMCRGFIQEHPQGDYDALVARFGTPEQIAAACIEEMEPEDLMAGLRLRRRILRAVAIAMGAAVLVWMLAVGGALVNEVRHADGYYDVAVFRD